METNEINETLFFRPLESTGYPVAKSARLWKRPKSVPFWDIFPFWHSEIAQTFVRSYRLLAGMLACSEDARLSPFCIGVTLPCGKAEPFRKSGDRAGPGPQTGLGQNG